ncbi:MAG TPA: hypothetical protein VFZ09_14450 [Archangium sp.]|uniref:hypothetical protein n=1 Tax=Archangium sp. TaxID=1872627 RepID=UPI002E342420|nr:hypothetical protein [Archangium sp.]HEX5747442.1 hypothetical protein [Archangium sp.]
MGQDKNGSALDYEVVLVHHTPLKPGGIDAEVYMKRVELPQEIKQRSPRSKRKK